MIITHASSERITEVKDFVDYGLPYRGCLFFGEEDNSYNLTECNFKYNLEVENVIRTKRFFYEHDTSESAVREVFDMMRNGISALSDAEDSVLADLLDETTSIYDDMEFDGDCAYIDWSIQQFQGILAHKLGYDCAESFDEQGTVYIAYCVNRKLQEVEC